MKDIACISFFSIPFYAYTTIGLSSFALLFSM
jgi:hypothetical protein